MRSSRCVVVAFLLLGLLGSTLPSRAESSGAVLSSTFIGGPLSLMGLSASVVSAAGGGVSFARGNHQLAWAISNDVAAGVNIAVAGVWGSLLSSFDNEGGYWKPTIHAMIATHAVAAAANLALGITGHVLAHRAGRGMRGVSVEPFGGIDSYGARVAGIGLRGIVW